MMEHETDNEHARATYAASDQAPAQLFDQVEVNGVSFNPLDPMVGYYDRVWAEGDAAKIAMHRNIPALIGLEINEPFSIQQYKEHLVTNGYGSRETVEKFWPCYPLHIRIACIVVGIALLFAILFIGCVAALRLLR